MNRNTLNSAFATFKFDSDVREPPMADHRRAFVAGWSAAVRGVEYVPATLSKLTWENSGYRLGKHFGESSRDQIYRAFDWLAQNFKNRIPPKGIPNGLTAKLVRRAARQLDRLPDSQQFMDSRKYDVVVDMKTYPPKAIVGIAAKLLTGEDYLPRDFSGGKGHNQANQALRELGFKILPKSKGDGSPSTWLLTWNPEKWRWPDFSGIVKRVQNGQPIAEHWTCRNKRVQPGDRVFLLRQGKANPGIVGRGLATSRTYSAPHWSDRDKSTTRIDVLWDALIDPDQSTVLSRESLLKTVGTRYLNLQHSGTLLPISMAAKLAGDWDNHYRGVTKGRISALPTNDPEENEYAIDNLMKQVLVRQRQSTFRKRVLENFGGKCCITGVDNPNLLVASHIVPWAEEKTSRLDPANGICLFVTFDRLFDQGYLSFTDDLRVLVKKLKGQTHLSELLQKVEGLQAQIPSLVQINTKYLRYHRKEIFKRR